MPRALRRRTLRCLPLLLALLCAAGALRGQTASAPPNAPTDSTTGSADAIRVFLDCQGETNLGCSSEFFVLELP